jgi:hypothetical protein
MSTIYHRSKEPDYRNVFLVADSLQEFLDGLTTSAELDQRPRTKRRY